VGLGKYLAYLAGLDHYAYTDLNHVTSTPAAVTAIMNSASARSVFLNSPVACWRLVENHNTATANVIPRVTATTYVGQFYNQLRVYDGLSINAELAGVTSMSTAAASATVGTTMAASLSVMKAVCRYSTDMATLGTSTTWFTGVLGDGLAQYWGAMAGYDPGAGVALSTCAVTNSLLAQIEADAPSRTKLMSTASVFDEFVGASNFRTYVGVSSNLWTTMQSYERSLCRFFAATSLLIDITPIVSYATLHTTGNWDILVATQACRNLLWNSDPMLVSVKGNATALASIRASGILVSGSWTDNGTTPVSIPSLVSSGKYIITGLSRNSSGSRTYVFVPERAGTTVANPVSSGTSSTTADDANTFGMPITAPATAAFTGAAASATSYFTALRCDA
jgi:hypothetical protein